ncbi:MAG: hypothetical protein JXR76_32295 [Deltaproteobacteria bacterium]|nr:hypothetical protein [Deltaproteobacteria bacterium]
MAVRIIYINDTTLRDGEQAPGVSFSELEKIQITEELLQIGVHEIEVGIAQTLIWEKRFLTYLQRSEYRDRYGIWCRANREDIEKALSLGLGTIHISVPVSDFQLGHMGYSPQWVLDTLEKCIEFVYQHADQISIGAQDATRGNRAFLLEMMSLLNSYNVSRLRFSDTVGIGIPSSIASLANFLSHHFCGELDFHGHNDLGMATANCVSAVENGVTQLSTTVNGIGERAGNAPLEQVAVAVAMGMERDTHIRLPGLQHLCEAVSMITERPIAPDKPIVGANVFTHESGVHCHGQTKHSLMYQPFSAETVGRTSKMVIGKHSGSTTVREVFAQMGVDVSRTTARNLLKHAHTNAMKIDTSNLLSLLTTSAHQNN